MVETMQEALDRIRADLGPNAQILNTRNIRKRSFFGLIGRNVLEVVAASVGSERSGEAKRQQPARQRKTTPSPEVAERQVSTEQFLPPTPEEDSEANIALGIRRALDGVFLHLNNLGILKDLIQHITFMLDETISSLTNIGEALEPPVLKKAFGKRLSEVIPIAGEIKVNPEQNKIITLVGPTGVGKTTTIAKLAANFYLVKGYTVGLVSIDAFRIGAFEQLKQYGEMMNLPVQLALTPQATEEAIKSYEDKDITFVDTVGRSPTNPVNMAELKAYVNAIQPDEVHLALPATTKYQDLMVVAEKYKDLKISNVLFTKLDETLSYDSLINVAYKVRRPISYFTIGQTVPYDIEEANIDKLVNFLLSDECLKNMLRQLKQL